jgi:hypothetical protein
MVRIPFINQFGSALLLTDTVNMREIIHVQAGQCGNQIGAKVH